MKIIEIENAKIPRFLGAAGITLYPFILYAQVPTLDIRFHEMTHVEQIKRDGFFKFYFMYAVYFLRSWTRGYSWENSYMQIPYEVDAYAAQRMFLSAANKDELFKDKLEKVS